MANEARIQTALQITVGNLSYMSNPTAFLGDVAGAKGPVPGAITVDIAPGTSIDFSELTTPGYCRVMNLDDTNFVEYGIWDVSSSTFYPLGEILPGETYLLRLSRNLQEEYGTGTGTTGSGDSLRFRAHTAPCIVLVEAFEV